MSFLKSQLYEHYHITNMPRKKQCKACVIMLSVSLLKFDLLIIYSNMQRYIYFSNFVTYKRLAK